ncbi:MAG: DUF2782 domain-containing protein [Methylococcales bacterium]|nr:DUF2782 domain-containing protein [Methylococcales bacterium]
MRFYLTLLGLGLAVDVAMAQDLAPEPPTLPRKVQSGVIMEPDPTVINARQPVPELDNPPMPIDDETLEPDITITRKDSKVIQEFRRNGQLYMVKVIPERGFPYYLIDTDGDGTLDVRGSDLERNLNINQWKLMEWK